jgi:hypothetical protein
MTVLFVQARRASLLGALLLAVGLSEATGQQAHPAPGSGSGPQAGGRGRHVVFQLHPVSRVRRAGHG